MSYKIALLALFVRIFDLHSHVAFNIINKILSAGLLRQFAIVSRKFFYSNPCNLILFRYKSIICQYAF